MEQSDPRGLIGRLVTERGESYAALSRMLGRNNAYLQQFVARGTPKRLAERDRALLAAYLGVDEALLGAPARAAPAPTVGVRLLDVAASAGPGRLNDAERATATLPFDRALLEQIGIRSTRLAMIEAVGDSMLPGIAHGDRILVDEDERRIDARGAVCVIRLDGVLLVKRVSLAGDRVTIASDNPEVPDLPVRRAREVEVIGRVVWLSRSVR